MAKPKLLTSLNLWVLTDLFKGTDRVPNSIKSTSAPHIRRCLHFGLIRIEGHELVLTDAGRAAMGRQ